MPQPTAYAAAKRRISSRYPPKSALQPPQFRRPAALPPGFIFHFDKNRRHIRFDIMACIGRDGRHFVYPKKDDKTFIGTIPTTGMETSGHAAHPRLTTIIPRLTRMQIHC